MHACDYESPDIGIEFSLKYGWSNEEIVYDFLKLLDKKKKRTYNANFQAEDARVPEWWMRLEKERSEKREVSK